MSEIKKKKLKKGVPQPWERQKPTTGRNPITELYKKEEEQIQYYGEEDLEKERRREWVRKYIEDNNIRVSGDPNLHSDEEKTEKITSKEKEESFNTAFALLGLSFFIVLSLSLANFSNLIGYNMAAQQGNGFAGLIYLYIRATAETTCLIAPLSIILFIAGMYKLKRSIGLR